MWLEMSLKYMLNSVADMQLPWGTPVSMQWVLEVELFHATWKDRLDRKSLVQFSRIVGSSAFSSL